MDGRRLQNRLYLGLGLSARHIGATADAFRPQGPFKPLNKENRFLRLPATFVSAKGTTQQTNAYGNALWHGVFDASYTRPGDYLVLETGIYFVASQAPLMSVLCVKTNRMISIARPDTRATVAGNAYGGYVAGATIPILDGWPASVLGQAASSSPSAALPMDSSVSSWDVHLPAVAGVTLAPGDFISDDLSRTAVISASELSDLGWRISARMATT